MAAKKSAKSGRARKATRKKARKTAVPKLYTLTQIGQMASVSMPTLQKYKRTYQDRIPSVGEGRKQRYPREAVAVLKQLKEENLAKRGRPRKSSAPQSKKAGAKAKKRAASEPIKFFGRKHSAFPKHVIQPCRKSLSSFKNCFCWNP